MLFNRSDSPKVPPRVGASTPHVIYMFPESTHPKLRLDIAVSTQLTAESVYYTMCVKTRLTCNYKLIA